MSESTITINEIKKALVCCINGKCKGCPLRAMNCSPKVAMAFSADFINRQKAEIESMQGVIDELWTTGERLKAEKDNLIRTYKECALEVVKEFAERLKAVAEYDDVCEEYSLHPSDIGNLVKEMVGERE